MRKPMSGQPKMRTNHDTVSFGQKPSMTKKADSEAKAQVRPRRSSIPPEIPGLYAPVSTRKDGPETVEEVVKSAEEEAHAASILQERVKMETILEERRRALAAQEAAKKARVARQQAQKEKRQREDYGACRHPETPRVKQKSVSADPSQTNASVVVELKPNERPPYVNRRHHLVLMSRAG